MKIFLLFISFMFCVQTPVEAQVKQAAQLATLSPMLLVVQSDIKNYKKTHYTLSTVAYLGTYMITGSAWKSSAITLLLGVSKELVYDGLMGRGEPLLEDMLWNGLGVAQGAVFTLSLKF